MKEMDGNWNRKADAFVLSFRNKSRNVRMS